MAYVPHIASLVGLIIAVAAVVVFGRGVLRVVRGLRDADDPASSLRLVLGIRGVVVGVGLLVLGGGIAFGSKGLLAFGVVFLAEEIYETGVLVRVLKAAR